MNGTPPFIVGLTGGIASGKTTVAQLFQDLGVEHVDADQVARDVVAPGEPALAEIVKAFGSEVLDADGCLDRAAMRRRVFAEPDARRRLEGIIHPRVRDEQARRLAAAGGPYVLSVIPLLFEAGREGSVQRVLVVDVPREVQLERVMQRDGSSREVAEGILAAQLDRDQRRARADDVIDNTGDLQHLRRQVMALHHRYLDLARRHAEQTRPLQS